MDEHVCADQNCNSRCRRRWIGRRHGLVDVIWGLFLMFVAVAGTAAVFTASAIGTILAIDWARNKLKEHR